MNLLIMGLPGAGKGTQAEMLVKDYGLLHISTGDMFRAAIKTKTAMGSLAQKYIDRGELVPDEVTGGIVQERLEMSDVKKQGFLLDGYPRTLIQAESLDGMLANLDLKLDAVINIDVDPSILVERISGRFICKTCGATYHKVNKLPKVVGICDVCGGTEFFQREDDKPETVGNRIEINLRESAPVLEHYRVLDQVKEVNGSGSIEETTREVKKILSKL